MKQLLTSSPDRMLKISAVTLFCLMAAAEVWLSHLRYGLSLERTEISGELQAVNTEINRFNLEQASMLRPEKLRQLARKKLGMGPPKPMQVIRP